MSPTLGAEGNYRQLECTAHLRKPEEKILKVSIIKEQQMLEGIDMYDPI